ncbi:hypothetical protein ElyMa_003724400 [Elysia marginata]|uniref:Secreted protein n=1 Tax=Elysia marginata TaxID=1093978 RepID=A0AAV4F611_9GAST|nr:hypothetical protein ElyMa_003724400 [Elysia marginata]
MLMFLTMAPIGRIPGFKASMGGLVQVARYPTRLSRSYSIVYIIRAGPSRAGIAPGNVDCCFDDDKDDDADDDDDDGDDDDD